MGTVLELKKREPVAEEVKEESKEESPFDDIQEMNRKNAERLAKERAQANKSVLRSYRIKN